MTRAIAPHRPPTRCVGDGGSSDALGLALIAPAMVGVALVILVRGRGVDSRATVQIAAESAAQAAAQQRSPQEAMAAAERAAAAMLVDELTCENPAVQVDVGEFRPGGVVSVSVSCDVSTAGLELLDLTKPDARSATAIATIDPFRSVEGGST